MIADAIFFPTIMSQIFSNNRFRVFSDNYYYSVMKRKKIGSHPIIASWHTVPEFVGYNQQKHVIYHVEQ